MAGSTIKKEIKSKFFYVLLAVFFVILPFQSSAQVIIKERLELKKDTLKSKKSYRGKFSTQSHNSARGKVYPRFSGSMTLKLYPFWEEDIKYEWELYEENYGKLTGIIDWHKYTTVEISSFAQWQKLDFYLKRANEDYERHVLDSHIVTYNDTSFITFDSILEDNPSSPGIHFPGAKIVLTEADSSKPTIPTDEFFNVWWWDPVNIYKPTDAFAPPDTGFLVVKVNSVRDDANYQLHMDLPEKKMISDSLNKHENDTLWAGYVYPSDDIRFYIRSSHNIVKNMPIYPGNVGSWRDNKKSMGFEGWTDLLDDDVSIELRLTSHPKEPSYLDVELQSTSLEPGDIVSVYVEGKRRNGETISFDQNHLFNVEFDWYENYLTILHPNGQDTADSFEDIPLGFKIIAENKKLPYSPLYPEVQITTKADGPYIKNKLIYGEENFKITKPKYELCKEINPNIKLEEKPQPDNIFGCKKETRIGLTKVISKKIEETIKTCLYSPTNEWGTRLASVYIPIGVGLCPQNGRGMGLFTVEGANQWNIDENNYCDISQRIKALLRYKNQGIGSAEQLDKIKLWSYEAAKFHEQTHVKQLTKFLREKMEEFANELKSISLPKNGATSSEEAHKILLPQALKMWNYKKKSINEEYKEKLREQFEEEALKAEVGIYQVILAELNERAVNEKWEPCE